MTNKEKLALGMNLAIPGGGQFALNRRLRGLIILVGCIIGAIWAFINMGLTFKYFFKTGIPDTAQFYAVFIKNVSAPIGVVALLFLYSFIDILIFKNKKEENPTDESNNSN